MAEEVGIVGSDLTPCKGRWAELSYYGLSQLAVKKTLEDAAIDIKDVDAVVYGIYNDIFEYSAIPEHPLQGIIGMANKPGMRVTCGGATGAYAMMAGYTMVKKNWFNGLPMPSIAVRRLSGKMEVVRKFGYGEFKGSLS